MLKVIVAITNKHLHLGIDHRGNLELFRGEIYGSTYIGSGQSQLRWSKGYTKRLNSGACHKSIWGGAFFLLHHLLDLCGNGNSELCLRFGREM